MPQKTSLELALERLKATDTPEAKAEREKRAKEMIDRDMKNSAIVTPPAVAPVSPDAKKNEEDDLIRSTLDPEKRRKKIDSLVTDSLKASTKDLAKP